MTKNLTVDEILNRMVERGAEAMHQVIIKRAFDSLNEIEFECRDLTELLARLINETETAQVLIFAGFLEDKFTVLFKLGLRHLTSQSVEDEIFGSNGPLSTFGNRINLAYQLGWLSEQQKLRLDAFRKIRNAFAHAAYKTSFKDQRIAALLRNMDFGPAEKIETVRKRLLKDSESDLLLPIDKINENSLLLMNFALLACETYEQMLVFQTSHEFKVDPNSLISDLENCPRPIKNVKLSLSEALLVLSIKKEFLPDRLKGKFSSSIRQ